MAKKGSGSFPKWATPMTERKLHGTDPCWEPDNAISRPKPPRAMFDMLISKKAPGYSIGTGGMSHNSERWHKDGRK